MISENSKTSIDAIDPIPEGESDRFRRRYRFYSPHLVLKEAKAGDIKSLIMLGIMLCEGPAVTENPELGMAILEELAVTSNLAKLELSWRYNIIGDVQKSFDLIQDLDKKGYLPATLRLAVLHKHGIGTEINNSKYNECIRRASKQGHMHAWKELSRQKMSSPALAQRFFGKLQYAFANMTGLIYFMIDRNHEKLIS